MLVLIVAWLALGGLGVIIARRRWFKVFGSCDGLNDTSGFFIQAFTVIAGLAGFLGASIYYLGSPRS